MSARASLYKIYKSLETRIAPGLRYAHYAYEEILTSHVSPGMDWLDVGCGHHILPIWRDYEEEVLVSRCRKVVGIDGDLGSLKKHRSIRNLVLGAISDLPFSGESFDLITANMVVEHLDDPTVQFREIARVLKLGGLFIVHTPNRNSYATLAARIIPEWAKKGMIRILAGRAESDVFRTFYRANSSKAIQQIAAEVGFSVRELNLTNTSAELAFVIPLVIFELIWLRALQTDRLAPWRTNIVAVLEKAAVQTVDTDDKCLSLHA